MSWDIMIYASEVPPPPVAEMTDEWRFQPLGPCREVRDKISKCLPEVDWSDPTWGTYEGDGFTLEFCISEPDICESIMVLVRGGGDAVAALLKLAQRWNWYFLDTAQGEWFHHCADCEAGWKAFQAYRDRVIGPGPASSNP
jgi:hypothetical protein